MQDSSVGAESSLLAAEAAVMDRVEAALATEDAGAEGSEGQAAEATEGQPEAEQETPPEETEEEDPAEPEAKPEEEEPEPPAKAEELDHAKAKARAEYVARKVAKLERKEAEYAAKMAAYSEREARLSSIERQLSSDDTKTVIEAIARIRRVDPSVLLREALGAFSGKPPSPEEAAEARYRQLREQEAEQARQAQQEAEGRRQVEAWRGAIRSGAAQFETLKDEDPAVVESECYALAEQAYREAVRRYGQGAKVPSPEQVLQWVHQRRTRLVERFANPTRAPETPPPAASAKAAKAPRKGAPLTNADAARPASPRHLTPEELDARVAALL